MQGRLTVLLLCMLAFQAHGAFKKDDEAFALRQAELEQRCEAARSEKLAPLREAAFQQCMNAKRGADTEADCGARPLARMAIGSAERHASMTCPPVSKPSSTSASAADCSPRTLRTQQAQRAPAE